MHTHTYTHIIGTVIAAPLGLDYGSESGSVSDADAGGSDTDRGDEDEVLGGGAGRTINDRDADRDKRDWDKGGGGGEEIEGGEEDSDTGGGEREAWHGMAQGGRRKAKLAQEALNTTNTSKLSAHETAKRARERDLACGKVVTFVDLLKSIPVFQHLTEDELYVSIYICVCVAGIYLPQLYTKLQIQQP